MPYIAPLAQSPYSAPSDIVHFDLQPPWPLHTKPAGLGAIAVTYSSEDAAIVDQSGDEAEHKHSQDRRRPRKLSGELVRPILRPPACTPRAASEPTSPTATKSVNFHSHLEETVDFFRLDCPMSINAGSRLAHAGTASTEYPTFRNHVACQWDMVTLNFPSQTTSYESRFVYLKILRLIDEEESLQGVVVVRNVAFQKSVTCRFTFDNWKTTSNVDARYSDVVVLGKGLQGYDSFVFTIGLSDILHLESKIAHLCVRYVVNGQEFWDNNNGRSFQVCFFKKALPRRDDIPLHGIPLHIQNGFSENPTPGRPPTSLFRGLDWATYYSISASLDATVRAARCNNACKNHTLASVDAGGQ